MVRPDYHFSIPHRTSAPEYATLAALDRWWPTSASSKSVAARHQQGCRSCDDEGAAMGEPATSMMSRPDALRIVDEVFAADPVVLTLGGTIREMLAVAGR